jgi:low affinity Fe/Cu permease
MSISHAFTAFANHVSRYTGRPLTFVVCIGLVTIWGLSGPVFHYSDTWQLVINTSTTIITFLMVFLIQNTQNRDNAAIQAKLDELIRVTSAENGFIGIEKLTDVELERILDYCETNSIPLDLVSKTVGAKAKSSRRKSGKPVAAKTIGQRAARATAAKQA